MKLQSAFLLVALVLGTGLVYSKPPLKGDDKEEAAKKAAVKKAAAKPGPAISINPPGPAGGAGTGAIRVNPPGPVGGRGTGTVRINPPGPVGGRGTSAIRVNPPGPVGGRGTSVVRSNPPGPVGGPGTSRLRLDSRSVLRGLSVIPRRIAPAVVVRPGAPVILPGRPRTLVRVYDRTRSVVLVPAEDGQSVELPYIAVPILFAAGTAELLDQTADNDLQALAEALLEIHAQDPDARFQIEGHTSADGDDAENQNLSVKRASHVYAVLVSRYGVPAAILSTKGYGEDYADYRGGTEEQNQLDRRVLVVRTR